MSKKEVVKKEVKTTEENLTIPILTISFSAIAAVFLISTYLQVSIILNIYKESFPVFIAWFIFLIGA